MRKVTASYEETAKHHQAIMNCSIKKIAVLLYALLFSMGVYANIWTGTGFALNSGYVVTNHHVADGANTLFVSMVKNNERQTYVAKVVATDADNDIAILKIVDKTFKGFGTLPYRVRTSLAEVGEDCFVLGYPMIQHMGTEIKLTTGVISSRSGYQGDKSTYQISAPIQPGNSGGPLFDANGNVIGITCSGISKAQSVGYAIKTTFLKNLIESDLTINPLPTSNSVSNLKFSEKVKTLKKYVFIIIASDECLTNDKTTPSQGSTSTPQTPSSPKPSNDNTVNNHRWVDLDLPSGTKWAACNVGATLPEEFGSYFAWGEATKKYYYDLSTYQQTKEDAATANWGDAWCIPTDAQWTELREHCIWKWTTYFGVNGYKVISKFSGNSIFLPATGYRRNAQLNDQGNYGSYWSSSLHEKYPNTAWYVYFYSDSVYRYNNNLFYGRSIRPVLKNN